MNKKLFILSIILTLLPFQITIGTIEMSYRTLTLLALPRDIAIIYVFKVLFKDYLFKKVEKEKWT